MSEELSRWKKICDFIKDVAPALGVCVVAVLVFFLVKFLAPFIFPELTRDDLQDMLAESNPDWHGKLEAIAYRTDLPILEFEGVKDPFNCIILSGNNLKTLSPLSMLQLYVIGLGDSNIESLNILNELNYIKTPVLQLEKLPNLTDFSALEGIPFISASVVDVPNMTSVQSFHPSLAAIRLQKTSLKSLDFKAPENLEELDLSVPAGAPKPDIRAVSGMKNIKNLFLDGVDGVDAIDFSQLSLLGELCIQNSDLKKLPMLAPDILQNVMFSDCPNLESLETLSGKMIGKLFLVRCSDPAKFMKNVLNAKIQMVVLRECEISSTDFLRQIENLRAVSFQNCRGDAIQDYRDPLVEIVKE